MTPDEERRLAELEAKYSKLDLGPTPSTEGLTAEPFPQQQQPDLQHATDRFLDAAERYDTPTVGPAEAGITALDRLADLRNEPAPVDREPSLWEQALLAFTPRVVRRDDRPLSVDERVGLADDALVSDVLSGALMAPTLGHSRGIAESATGLRAESSREVISDMFGLDGGESAADLVADPDSYGMKAENETLYLLRLLGTVVPAAVQETALRLGGDWLLGTTPELRGQRVQRENPAADWLQGVLEKIETGRGLEADLQAAAKVHLPDNETAQNAAWWTGLAIDTFTNWEGIAAKGPKALIHAVSAAERLEKVFPGEFAGVAGKLRALGNEVLPGAELHAREGIARKEAEAVTSGRTKLSDYPLELQHRISAVALELEGKTSRELFNEQGLDVVDIPVERDIDFTNERDILRGADPEAPDLPSPKAEPAPLGFRVGGTDFSLVGDGGTRGPGRSAASERTVYVTPAIANELRRHLRTSPSTAGTFLTAPSSSAVREITGNVHLAREIKGTWRHVGSRTYSAKPKVGLVPVELRKGADYTVGPKSYRQYGDVKPGKQAITELLVPNPKAPDLAFAVRQARNRGRVAIQGDKRPIAEAPRVPPRTTGEYFHYIAEVIAKGFSTPRGTGFWSMKALDPTQTINSIGYVLRNAVGDVIGRGTFRQMLELMLRRGLDNEEIWYGARPAARWRRTDKPILASDWHFSSPEERAVIRKLRGTDPRAIPPKLKTLGVRPGPDAPGATGRTVGSVLLDLMTDAPHARSVLPPPTTPVGRVVEEAIRAEFVARTGADRFVPLNGAMVPRYDRKRIVADTDTVMQALGLGKYEGQVLDEAAERKVASLAKQLHVDLGPRTPGTLRPAQYTQLRQAVQYEVGGLLTSSRLRLQGVPSFADRMQNMLATAGSNREVLSRPRAAMERYFGGALRAVFGDRLAGMPQRGQILIKEATEAARHVSDGLYEDIRKALPKEGGDLSRVLHHFTSDIRLVSDVESKLAGEILDAPVRKDADWFKVRDELLPLHRRARGEWLTSKDAGVVREAVLSWAAKVQDDVDASATEYLQAYYASARGSAAHKAVQTEQLGLISAAAKRAVHEEVFGQGIVGGPATQRAFGEAKLSFPEADETQVLASMILRSRTSKALDDIVRKLLDEDLVVLPGDPRRHAITMILEDQHKTVDALGRDRWKLPEATASWAMDRLDDWGMQPGTKAPLGVHKVGRTEVIVPQHLAEEFERLDRLGLIDSRQVFGSKILNDLLRLHKRWTMGIWFVPRPGHFVAQALATLPTRYTTGGLEGLAQTGSSLLRHPIMTGELMRRIGGVDTPIFRELPSRQVFTTADGRAFHIDELEQALRAQGVQDTMERVETAEQLANLLNRTQHDGPTAVEKIKAGAAWWNNLLMTMSGGFDQAGRVATFLSELERGASPDQAARTAKEAFLDFGNMTEAEQTHMRWIFEFYAFMRKNADAYVRALVRHPERISQQARLAHASATEGGLSDMELGAMQEQDTGRFTLYSSDEVVTKDGRVHPLYRFNRLQSAPMGVGEFLSFMVGLKNLVLQKDPSQIAQSMGPIPQTAFALTTQHELLGADWGYDRDSANRIPPYLMKFPPVAGFVGTVFGVEPIPLGEHDDPLKADPDASLAYGAPAYWAAKNRKLWQMFRIFMGGPIRNVDRYAMAAGVEEPRPHLTTLGEFWSMLGDIRATPTDTEIERRYQRDTEVKLEQAAGDLAR